MFVNQGTDARTVEYIEKSMNMEVLEKSDRSKLVPKLVPVNRDGKVSMETRLVNPSKDQSKSTQSPNGSNIPAASKPKKKPLSGKKTQDMPGLKLDSLPNGGYDAQGAHDYMLNLKEQHGTDNVIKAMKKLGLEWKECDHAGINWMRCTQEMQKVLRGEKQLKPKEKTWKDTAKAQKQIISAIKAYPDFGNVKFVGGGKVLAQLRTNNGRRAVNVPMWGGIEIDTTSPQKFEESINQTINDMYFHQSDIVAKIGGGSARIGLAHHKLISIKDRVMKDHVNDD